MPEKITLTTSDNLKLAATYTPGSGLLGIVLAHMMPDVRSSYDQLAVKLNEQGWHTLALDLRGHGDSEGGDYLAFTDEQHQMSLLDITAAVEFLKHKNLTVGLIGASIGANLAIQYASKNPVDFVVALSAGLEYRGVKAIDYVTTLDCPILFLASRDDQRTEGAADYQAQMLWNSTASAQKSIRIYDSGGHGTDMINGDFDRQKFLINWIIQIL